MSAVFVTGHSRSGTSLTAGLLASQGVWFGPCNEPASINKKGFFESTFVKDAIKRSYWSGFSRRWDEWREKHFAGYVWGVKTGPEYYRHFSIYQPLVICTVRDQRDIIASRERAGFLNAKSAMRKADLWISRLPSNTMKVYPDEFIQGDFRSLKAVLSVVGLPFNADAAESWVDPSLWSGCEKQSIQEI